MKADQMCPSRDFGAHIYKDGLCVFCTTNEPRDGACEDCLAPMTHREAQTSLWENNRIICYECEVG